jgi:hypothetical protein
MIDEEKELAGIRANADLVVEKLGPSSDVEPFGFDEASLEWLDGFIERQREREDATPVFVDRMINILGSYLGECIIRSYGGRWSRGEEGWRVELDAKNAAFPFAKVRKQFENGEEDSVYSFFTLIPLVFPGLRARLPE